VGRSNACAARPDGAEKNEKSVLGPFLLRSRDIRESDKERFLSRQTSSSKAKGRSKRGGSKLGARPDSIKLREGKRQGGRLKKSVE